MLYCKQMVNEVLLVDFMYLWNKLYYVAKSNPEKDFLSSLHITMKKIAMNALYTRKYVVLDGADGTKKHKKLLSTYKEGRADKTAVYKGLDDFISYCSHTYPNIFFLRAQEREADEVIAAMVKSLVRKENKVYVYSGDKDLLQLMVYPSVYVSHKYCGNFAITPLSDKELQKKLDTISGSTISKVGDILKFRIFRGDTSDKIPAAIPRLPSKVICNAIGTWKGITPLTDEVIENMKPAVTESTWEKIEEHKEDLKRNWELMQLQHLDDESILAETKRLK